jgi:hypothetical protein
MRYKTGDLVKWFEEYADIPMVKDIGNGIIVSSRRYSYDDNHYITYQVYRNKHNDKMSFEERNIEKL